jgi:hypothetical protein
MSGPIRWFLFFAVIMLAGACVTALWAGMSEDLLKAFITFALVAIAFVALFALGRKRLDFLDLTTWSDYMVRHDHPGKHRRGKGEAFRPH